MNGSLTETDRQTERETDRDFGSVWPGADKTKNRSNPPPAYSPDSRWPGPPCITKQRDRDTMTQKVWDRKWEDWQTYRWAYRHFFTSLSFTSVINELWPVGGSVWCHWAKAEIHVAYSTANSINMMRCDGQVERKTDKEVLTTATMVMKVKP